MSPRLPGRDYHNGNIHGNESMSLKWEERKAIERELSATRDPRRKGTIHIELSRDASLFDPALSLNHAEKALKIGRRLQDIPLMIAALTRAADAVALLADYPSSIERARQAIALCEESGIEGALLADAWLQVGTALHATYQYQIAVEALERAESLAEASGNLPMLMKCLGQKGNLLRITLGVPQSLEIHMRCLLIAEELGDPMLLCRAHAMLGRDYVHIDEFDDALHHFELNLRIAREESFEIEESKVLIEIGGSLVMKDMFEPGIRYLEQAREITERLGLRRLLAGVFSSLGTGYGRMGDAASALHYLQKSCDLRNEIGDVNGSGHILIYIAEWHLEYGDAEVAESIFLQGMRVVTEGGYKDLELFGAKKLAMAQEKLGKIPESLATLKRYLVLKDELDSRARGRAVARAELMARQRIIEREREVIELKARQLERDMEFKSRELATMTLNLAQQSQTIASIRKEVLSMKHAGSAAEVVDLLIERLRQYDNAQQGWDSVEQQFQSIHPGFLKKLSELCPKLTPMELKICALLKLNISSKQIATFLCASVRTVDNHRLHIRQKLELPPDTNLTTYLASL